MRIELSLAGVAALLALAGCGSSDPPTTPTACLADAPAYLRALQDAPGEVRLAANTAISSCLVSEQPSGALQTVGKAIVAAATDLNREARRGDRRAVVRLGYLVGAVQAGAAATGGAHSDLVLRLDSAARYPGPAGRPFTAAFERPFGAGFAAGRRSG